ncbi:hypothetical protein C8R48DRAFT_53681 [Suillus tomentosus]|nr:hypothetical protein C8R48DRAFT_53681 [Suillus tomentosus]
MDVLPSSSSESLIGIFWSPSSHASNSMGLGWRCSTLVRFHKLLGLGNVLSWGCKPAGCFGCDASKTLKVIQHPISRQAQILAEVCSFVATRNVLRLQRLLHSCGEHLVPSRKRSRLRVCMSRNSVVVLRRNM